MRQQRTIKSRSLIDKRVFQAWDPAAELGVLLQSTPGMTDTAWDVYLVYPTGITWDDAAPPEPVFWMHQLSEQYGVGDGPYLDADTMHAEVRRQLLTID